MQKLAYETMATKSNLVNYKSISKPSYGGGGSSRLSTYITSLTKKQNAAEDAILDNQYEEGIITPENYLNALKSRLGRDYLTPLQIVNLQEKMVTVGEKVNDASVDRQYKAGEITTSQVYSYEKSKLDKMTATDSPTYNAQATKVQQLKDKAEKETRAEYRLAENVRISKLPEDSSANLWAKAKLYENLQNQATLDGDTSQAMAYEATKNNYTASAKRADINDIITGAKNTVSGMTEGGMGVPDSGAGQTFYNKLTGQNEPITEGSTPAPTSAAMSGGAGVGAGTSVNYNNPAITNAYESLDRGQKTIDRLYGDLKQKEYMLGKFNEAINKAEGDQKTQLITQRNNIVDGINQTNNSISIAEQGINDTVTRIQELQQKAVASAFNQETKKNELALKNKEEEIKNEFITGKIDKQEFINKLAGYIDPKTNQYIQGLIEYKNNYFNEVSNVFSQYGDEYKADKYLIQANNLIPDIDGYNHVKNNPDDYESIAIDPTGRVSDDISSAFKIGKFVLTNVRREKDAGTFDLDYVQNKGGYSKVIYPGILDKAGFPVSASMAEELKKLNEEAVIYTIENGKQITKQINFVTFTDDKGKIINVKPILSDQVNTLMKKGVIKQTSGATNYTVKDSQVHFNPDGSVNFSIPPIEKTTADKIYEKVGEKYKGIMGTIDYMGKNKPQLGTVVTDSSGRKMWQPQIGGFKPGFLETPIKKGQELLKNVGTGISDFLGGKYGVTEIDPTTGQKVYMPFKKKPEGQTSTNTNPLDFVTQAIEKMKTFSQVQAADTPALQNKVTQGQVNKVITALPENERNAATRIAKALKEQGILDANTLAYAMATMKHETAGSFQPVNEGYYNDENFGYEPGFTGKSEARKRGYDGGENYYGRGYIQLTGLGNYKTYGDALGIDLVGNPELANDPEIAAKIMALYMKERGTANLAKEGRFVDARGTINQDDKGQYIAGIAQQYLKNAPLLKSLITTVSAADRKPVDNKPSLKLRYEDPKPKNFFQNIKDFFIKPAEASTVNRVVPPKKFVPQISTNQGVKTIASTQPKSSTPSTQNKSNQPFTPQISTNQGTKTFTPTPVNQTFVPAQKPTYQMPPPISKPPPVQFYKPPPSPAKPSIVQNVTNAIKNVSKSVSNWVSNLFKKK